MKFIRNLDYPTLLILWFIGTLVTIVGVTLYQNTLEYQLKLHVLQCIEKIENSELCEMVIKK